MKETLTAKEWVDKYNDETDSQYSDYDCNYPMMEQYANYRTKELKNKIIEFSKQLKTISKGREYSNILQDIETQYNEHFNIK